MSKFIQFFKKKPDVIGSGIELVNHTILITILSCIILLILPEVCINQEEFDILLGKFTAYYSFIFLFLLIFSIVGVITSLLKVYRVSTVVLSLASFAIILPIFSLSLVFDINGEAWHQDLFSFFRFLLLYLSVYLSIFMGKLATFLLGLFRESPLSMLDQYK